MKPSNYNYLKRMWTREACKRGCCLTSIVVLPFKFIWIILKPFLIIIAVISLISLFLVFALVPILIFIFIYLIYLLVKYLFTRSFDFGLFKICYEKFIKLAKSIIRIFNISDDKKCTNYSPIIKSYNFHRNVCDENSAEEIENPEHSKNSEVNENVIDEKPITSEKVEDNFDLERFMAECNSYVEHKENMEKYQKYFGIDDDDKEV